jgi:hypothetical protein
MINSTFPKLNESRAKLLGMSEQIGALNPELRTQLEHTLRMGEVSTHDLAQAKQIINSTKVALEKFFEMSGLDPQFRPFLAKVIGMDFLTQTDFGNPKALIAVFEQLAATYANLSQYPTPSNVENVLEAYRSAHLRVDKETVEKLKSGDENTVRELAAQKAKTFADRGEVYSAVMDLTLRVQRADFDLGVGGTLRMRRDDALWSLRAGGATVALMQLLQMLS